MEVLFSTDRLTVLRRAVAYSAQLTIGALHAILDE